MKKKFKKKHKLFLAVGIITTPLMIMDPYNWWLIAIIIIIFLIIAFMTKGPIKQKQEL